MSVGNLLLVLKFLRVAFAIFSLIEVFPDLENTLTDG